MGTWTFGSRFHVRTLHLTPAGSVHLHQAHMNFHSKGNEQLLQLFQCCVEPLCTCSKYNRLGNLYRIIPEWHDPIFVLSPPSLSTDTFKRARKWNICTWHSAAVTAWEYNYVPKTSSLFVYMHRSEKNHCSSCIIPEFAYDNAVIPSILPKPRCAMVIYVTLSKKHSSCRMYK